jgi:hypothetical protein
VGMPAAGTSLKMARASTHVPLLPSGVQIGPSGDQERLMRWVQVFPKFSLIESREKSPIFWVGASAGLGDMAARQVDPVEAGQEGRHLRQ